MLRTDNDGRRTSRFSGPELALIAPAAERSRYAHRDRGATNKDHKRMRELAGVSMEHRRHRGPSAAEVGTPRPSPSPSSTPAWEAPTG